MVIIKEGERVANGNLRYIEEKVKQPFLYTGAYFDRETGLYYLRARYYSPELRRFTQRDPILFKGGINLYSYTGCDFVNWGDWEGLNGIIGVIGGSLLVIDGGAFIGCTLLCFNIVEKQCENICSICDKGLSDLYILKCRNLKFKFCLPYCSPILTAISCIASSELCALEMSIRFANEIRKKLCN